MAQGQENVISMKDGKVTQLIFSSPIKSFKGGIMPSDFAISTEENVVYIQPLDTFPESNLNVITTDGYYYSFTVRFDNNTSQFNYIFEPAAAIYRDKNSIPVEKQSESGKPEATQEAPEHDIICKRILQQNGYLLTRNVVRMKNFSMILKAVSYTHLTLPTKRIV